MRAGPSSVSTRTAEGSHSPAPASSVSRACSAGLSSPNTAAAMPPCAHDVEPAVRTSFVTIVTSWCRAARIAVMSPAMPLPMTRMCAMT